MKKTSLFVSLLMMTVMSAQSQNRNFADTTARLDSLFLHWNTHTPGGVLTVARGSQVLYNKAGGMADLEHRVALSTGSIFEAGSVSKQFTATCVLLLIDEGKISLDDDIRKYFPEMPDYGKPILIKHMLVHTSGLKDWGSIAVFGGWPRTTRAYTNDHAREIIFRQRSLNFPPGTEYSYSNSNYTLLTELVQRVSGESFITFTRERLFRPIGMTQTTWRDDFRNIVPNRAIAYQRRGSGYAQEMPFENTFGHAALLTTTRDLLTWLRYWADNKFGEKLTKMRENQGITNDGDTIAYAQGAVRITRYNGVREVAHSGATAGYRAWLAFYPERDLSVVYLSNDEGTVPTSSIGKKVARIFLGEADEPVTRDTAVITYDPAIDALNNLPGTYYSDEADATFTVTVTGNKVILLRSPATRMTLRPTGPDSFAFGSGMSFRFIRDRKKKITGFTASVERARNIVFKRVN